MGNKIDLQGVVTETEGRKLAEQNQIPFILTSAKNDQNVQDAFMNLIKTILASGIVKKPKNNTLVPREPQSGKKSCCN